jgi:hypothetical protein
MGIEKVSPAFSAAEAEADSRRLFHCPQSGHRPSHFGSE